ncbi:hypothetical protein [Amycolatopsis sp. NBRC 101858]|uniref:hypothetical protein n=1 Tax=Amycolatopsis sp. NBRC 101858 TaxID=3032200 RepID=UPI002555A489|nr:hypothetical protein [Amycolatopsis sp. NBRC 101858]
MTYRTAVAQRTGPRGRLAAGFDGRCTGCGTEYAAEVVSREYVVLRVAGGTCPTCNPAQGGGAAGEAAPTVKVWWDAPNGETPRWKTSGLPVDESSTGGERTRPRDRDAAVDAEWLDVGSPKESFSPSEWDVIAAAWRPESCDIFGSLAVVIKKFWSAVPAGSTAELVIRLAHVPAPVAALISDLLARCFDAETGQHFHALDSLLHRLGILLCAGTGRISGCGAVRAELGRAPAAADRVLLDRPDFVRVRTKIAGASPLPMGDALELSRPEPLPSGSEPAPVEPPREPDNPLARELARLARRGELSRAPAVFGS